MKQRERSNLAPPPSSNKHTAESLAMPLDTCTFTEFTYRIQQLPINSQDINNKGTLITKRQLSMSHWASYKTDERISHFQTAVMQAYPPSYLVTQYDTQLVNARMAKNTHGPETYTTQCITLFFNTYCKITLHIYKSFTRHTTLPYS
jgi:hypothetical protein